jgi:ACS family hexuronate transporter-like MFS transporter
MNECLSYRYSSKRLHFKLHLMTIPLSYASKGALRPPWFRWYVCGLLLLATTVNYMDRLTLSSAAPQIKADFHLSNEKYGELETWFGLAFAVGSLAFGLLSDQMSVRLLYPAVLLAWSFMGIATAWMQTFGGLLACRTLLGWFESAHWSCALKTTQRLLPPGERTLGNSVLQLGASVGAVVTPLVLAAAFAFTQKPGTWRIVFQAIGAIGIIWAALWFTAVRESDLAAIPDDEKPKKSEDPADAGTSFARRFIVLSIMVIAISISWQMFRVWLLLFLREGRQYSEQFALSFTSAYYLAAGVGCALAGWISIPLQKRGISVSTARLLVYAGCSALTALSVAAAFTPAGNLLVLELLLYGAGSLGLFPCYYALSQELSIRHQGKITGILGTIAWVATSPLHKYFGRYIDVHHSYNLGIAIVGCMPLVGLAAWWFIWDFPAEPALTARRAPAA